jgi:phosphotransferase system enzyme I (PtsP)
MSTTPRLIRRLRDTLASGQAPLQRLVELVAAELVAEVCSVYVVRPGDLLELVATVGLASDAVGRTRLRVGEGIVGVVAATGRVLNLPDAQNHPAFVYRSETREEVFASMLAVPVRRASRIRGVLAIQNRATRRYTDTEIDELETVAMVLAELLINFGDADGAEQGFASTLPRRFPGTRLVGGIAVGPVMQVDTRPAPRRLLAENIPAERARLADAAKIMQRDLDALIARSFGRERDQGAHMSASREVLQAYRLIAADAGWLRRVDEAVRSGLSAEAAVARVAGDTRDRLRRLSDPYLRERVADLDDLAGRLLTALGGELLPIEAHGAILVARRLGPAALLEWHARGIAALALEEATATGHAAIIARALGLPTLAGLHGLLDAVEQNDEAVLDANEGLLVLRPHEEMKQAYIRGLALRHAREAEWSGHRTRPAITSDGTRVRLMLNIGLAMELDYLEPTGADGIGLLRTEIAMLARGRLLDVAEQVEIYRRVLDVAGNRPVMFRTLDLGGDKLLPDAPPPSEENPAMGWRSLRVGLDRPALLRRQLRAMLMAAEGRMLSVMFPMVATVAEFRAARRLLLMEAASFPESRLQIGVMLEIPALMWQLDVLLPEVDFVSVGTNDLMQFVFAADRGSPDIAGRYDLLSPPALNLLAQLHEAAARAEVALSICGDAASHPLEALTLVALGYTTLSMPASGVMPVKSFLANVDLAAFRGVLAVTRRRAAGAASLRPPLAAWAREHGLNGV